MYKTIMVPVDISHPDHMQKAIRTALDIAQRHDGEITLVGLTAPQPSSVATTPEEFRRKLADYAKTVAGDSGVTVNSHAIIDHDPSADLDRVLLHTASDLGADLAVMASHVPRFGGPSHGGSLAAHADISVFVVRGD